MLPEGALEAKLALGRPLRVKLGIDVTSPDIHVGRAIPLQRMRAFQEAGHVGVLIIGDYTTRIGDPSGRSTERPVLSDEEIDRNARTYLDQAAQIIRTDGEVFEVRFNGEWLAKLDFAEIVRLTRVATVAELLTRDDFRNRFEGNQPISVSELLYPLMQGYDSVAVAADVELGGTDQLYNLLMGRDVMEHYGLEPQAIVTYELLVGTDGKIKMSKSEDNYVGIDEPPQEQFGKVMSIPDEALDQWWRLTLDAEPPPDAEAMTSKLALARGIVERYHGPEAAVRAEEHFTRVVRRGEAPDEVPDVRLVDSELTHLPALLVKHLGLPSTSEARRLIAQGGLKLDGETVTQMDVPTARLDGAVIQAGKRRFVRVRVA